MATAEQRFEADKKFVYRALQDARQYVTDFDRTGSKAEALYERLARADRLMRPWSTDGTPAQAKKAIEYLQEITSILSEKIGPASRREFSEQGGSRHHATKKSPAQLQREINEALAQSAWVPASRAETARIIDARRTEALRGTLPVESAVELTKAYQGLKRGSPKRSHATKARAKSVTASKETSVLPPSVRVARDGLETVRKFGIKNLRYGLYRIAGDRMYQWGNFTGTGPNVHVITAVVPNEKNTASQEALVRALKWKR